MDKTDKEVLHEIKAGVNDIRIVLRGVPEYHQKGLIDDFNDLSEKVRVNAERLSKVEQGNARQKIVVGTASAIGGAAAGWGGKALLAKLLSVFTIK